MSIITLDNIHDIINLRNNIDNIKEDINEDIDIPKNINTSDEDFEDEEIIKWL